MRINILLEAAETGERIYLTSKNRRNTPDRLELKKYSPKLRRNASPVRIHRRDKIDGRPRAYMREFGMSRLNFRDLAHKGQIPGVKKASW